MCGSIPDSSPGRLYPAIAAEAPATTCNLWLDRSGRWLVEWGGGWRDGWRRGLQSNLGREWVSSSAGAGGEWGWPAEKNLVGLRTAPEGQMQGGGEPGFGGLLSGLLVEPPVTRLVWWPLWGQVGPQWPGWTMWRSTMLTTLTYQSILTILHCYTLCDQLRHVASVISV